MVVLRDRHERDSDPLVVGRATVVRAFRLVLSMIRPFETQDAPRPETTALVPQVPITDTNVRCGNTQCRKLLAEQVTRPYRFSCPRCKQFTISPPS